MDGHRHPSEIFRIFREDMEIFQLKKYWRTLDGETLGLTQTIYGQYSYSLSYAAADYSM